ncbi:MAG: hydrolase [Rhodovarius sp.]|nr:hydrolase [Rhodovarius sp.]MCX7930917.1 hydrolase [Rhodovarius sp.]MDW8313741.1 hydrolase [Rhodovarius sp.]
MSGLRISRRALPGLLAAPLLARPGRAQPASPAILFVHGNGDHAALWVTQIWRFQVHGVTALRAVNMPDPLARANDAVPQPHRSSSTEQTDRLAAFVEAFRAETGAARIALVGSSRGGYPIRDFVVHRGGSAVVSHAVLCGTPNRGVFDWEFNEGSEFNARSPFLRRLNGGETDVVPGTAFLTLRSDNDLFAQPDGRFVGRPGVPTGINQDGPMLRGATNLLLPGLDHREVAFHPRAFAEMYRFIVGREVERLDIPPEEAPLLDGQITGVEAGVQTNRPVAGARVAVYRIDESGQRIGPALQEVTTGADGRWGPVRVRPDWRLEWEVAAPGHPILHLFRGPFPRSADVLHIRPPLPPAEGERGAPALLRMMRPRGYFGTPRDLVLLDGERPALREGVPSQSLVARTLPAERLGSRVVGLFNEERVIGRAVPLAEGRIAVLEILS